MMKLINFFRASFLLLLFVLLLFFTWLINSEPGLRFALQQAKPYLPGELQLDDVSGRISGPIRIGKVIFQQETLRIEGEQLLIDWSPTALLRGQLRLRNLSATSLTLQLPAGGDEEPATIALPEISLPFAIAIDALEIGRISLAQAEQTPIVIDELALSARMLLDEIDIVHFALSSFGVTSELKGEIALSGNYPHALTIDWHMAQTAVGAASGSGRLEGDLKQTRLTHTLAKPLDATLDLQVRDLLEQLSWQGELAVEPVALQKLSPALPPFSVGLKSHLSGDLQQQRAQGGFTSRSKMLGPLDGEFDISHAGGLIEIGSLLLQTADKSRSARAHGQWQIAGNSGEFGLAWQGLSWPWLGENQVSSAQGSAYFKGGAESFILHLSGDLASPYWSASRLSAVGTGTPAGLDFQMARLQTLEGELQGPVKLDWSSGFTWKTKLQGKQLNPAVQWPEWPGRIDFAIDSEGDIKEDIAAKVKVEKLSGTLRGYPVQLSGNAAWLKDELLLDKLVFTSAGSRISADGQIGSEVELAWRLTSKNLAELHPDVQGALSASGNLTGAREIPLLQLQLEGQALAWQTQQIGAIKANGQVDLFNWQAIDLDAEAKTLLLSGQAIELIDIKVTTQAERQQLALRAKHEQASIALRAAGALHEQQWQGNLNGISIVSRDFGTWRQEQNSALTLAVDDVQLQPLCLLNAEQRLCLSLKSAQQTYSAAIDGRQIALGLLSQWLPESMALYGDADLQLRARYQTEGGAFAKGEIRLNPGRIDYTLVEGELESWPYQRGRISLKLDESGLSSDAVLEINEQDHIRASAALPGLDPFAFDATQQALQGNIQIKFTKLDMLQSLVFDIQETQGELLLQAELGGTLHAPQLNADLALTNGRLVVPRLGLDIHDVSLTARSPNRQRIDYQLKARSGDGHLNVSGTTELLPEQGWPTQLRIKGDSVEVSNIPEAKVNVSPDLSIKIQGQRIDTEGEVVIPYARLQPIDRGSAKLPSDDVYIEGVNGNGVEKWQIYSSVRLILGNRVTLYGFGFEGRIDGNVLLIDKPNAPTIGVGELNVPEGRYRAYGQRLDIERGRLLFASSPINNPGLDLRAVRKVEDVTAGISVSGTLRSPSFEVFSVPAMSQTNALSYLILGRPLEDSSGTDGDLVAGAALALGLKGGDFLARKIGDRFNLDEMRVETSDGGDEASLVMGRYLSPKLYISYGVGLIDAVNTVNLRYQLSTRWQLTAESGKDQGADVLYTIER